VLFFVAHLKVVPGELKAATAASASVALVHARSYAASAVEPWQLAE
jgi:hypothetical protein